MMQSKPVSTSPERQLQSSKRQILTTDYHLPTSACIAVITCVTALRVLVGYQPHSGQDGYHGLHSAYGGDFECQRHWMEKTWQLPLSRWYWYDLYYWGLDYPPLSGYLSWICGGLSSVFVGPESVALDHSRGFEDPVHKSFMRATVVLTDILFYGSTAWHFTKTSSLKCRHTVSSLFNFGFIMIQPAILLIDHGHFQYNTTSLGLSLWSFYFMTMPFSFEVCIVGSIFFCFALSFKQMTLYYAPAVFFYLLGRCFAATKVENNMITESVLVPRTKFWKVVSLRFLSLGMTVICCFIFLWWPFVVYGPSITNYTHRFLQVLRRVIPLQRGLFEGKVSNIWCALSSKPLSLRHRIPEELQPLAALSLTILMLAPSSFRLFCAGSRTVQPLGADWLQTRNVLLWGSASSALAFFLASFQVHEKSILMALTPISFLITEDATFCEWFSIVAAWSLWPLVQLDRLQLMYFCTIGIFVCFSQMKSMLLFETKRDGFFERNLWCSWIPPTTYSLMIAMHIIETLVKPPRTLPDIFVVLRIIIGCGFFCLAWIVTCWHLIAKSAKERLSFKEKSSWKCLVTQRRLQLGTLTRHLDAELSKVDSCFGILIRSQWNSTAFVAFLR